MHYLLLLFLFTNLVFSQEKKPQPSKEPSKKVEDNKTEEDKQRLRDKIKEALKKRENGRFGDKRFK